MSIWQRSKQDRAIKEATEVAARAVARSGVPQGAIDHFVAGLESILTYYGTCAVGSRPDPRQIHAAGVALDYARRDRLVAEKLTAFCAAFASQLGADDVTQELAFQAAAIQGEQIIRYTASSA